MPTPTNLANLNLAAALSFAPLARTWYSDEFRRLGAIAHFDPSLGATDDGTTSTWVDQIAGESVTSASQATRLVLSSSVSGLNNRPGWTGSYASATKLISSGATLAARLTGNTAYTIYAVKKAAAPAATAAWIQFGNSATGHNIYHGVTVTSLANKSIHSRTDGAQTVNQGSTIRPLTDAIIDSIVYSGTTYASWGSGGPNPVGTEAATRAPNLAAGKTYIGGLSGGNSFDGVIGDIIIFLGAHTDAQRMVVERLLAQKYGWPCIRGVSGFSTSNYLANAGLTSGIRGDNTGGVWSDVLIRPDATPSGTQYLESAWAGVAGQSIVSSGTALGFTAGNATANATSPTRTISAADLGKLMIFGGAAGPANLARGFVNGAEISAGTALTGYAKDTATAFSAGARAAVSPATSYSIFGIAGGDSAQVAANHAARAAAIKAAGRFVFNAGVAATHGWRFETPGAYHADAVGVDMLTLAGTLTETQIIVPTWPW